MDAAFSLSAPPLPPRDVYQRRAHPRQAAGPPGDARELPDGPRLAREPRLWPRSRHPRHRGRIGGRQSQPATDSDADELRSLLKSKVESLIFLEKLGSIQKSVYQKINEDDNASWNIVTAMDSWGEKQFDGENDSDYVFVSQEDIVESMACFMAAYLLSLKQTKELTPNQLQEALCKAFSIEERKSRLRKVWEASRVVYNVASWGATAVGIYNNPVIVKTASVALWSSCRVVAKLF